MDPFQWLPNRILIVLNLLLLALVLLPATSPTVRATLGVILVLTGILQLALAVPERRRVAGTTVHHGGLAERRRSLARDGALTSDEDAIRRLLFAHLVLYPAQTRRRVREVIDMAQAEYRKSAVMEISLDDVPADVFNRLPDSLYVPLMRPRKERMINGLEVRSSTGALLPTLTREEALMYETQIARDLFSEAFGLPVSPAAWPPDAGRAFLRTVDSFIREPQLDLQDPVKRDEFRRDVVAAAQKLWADEGLVAVGEHAKTAARALAELIRLTSTRVVIIAIAPRARRLTLVYSYDIPRLQIPRPGRATRIARFKSTLRNLLNIEPLVMSTPVEKAKSCLSYQLQLKAPPGSHFSTIELVGNFGGVDQVVPEPRSRDSDIGGEYFRIAGQGTETAHFHSRQLQLPQQMARVDVRLIETPPGSIGRCVITASATLAFVIVGGIVAQHVSTAASSAAAVGLVVSALPLALAGVSYVTRSKLSQRRVMSLLGFVYGWWIFLVGLAGATILAVQGIHVVTKNDLTEGLVQITDKWWTGLLRVAVATLVVAVYIYVLRRVRYHRLIGGVARAPEDSEAVIAGDE